MTEKDKQSPPSKPSGLSAFWAELKRRKVVRVGITYAIVGWVIIQIAVNTFPSLLIPGWALSFVIMCVILGFPVALLLAWAFELTPDGIKSTKATRSESSHTRQSAVHSKKRNWLAYAVGAAVPSLIFSILALFFYVRSGSDAQMFNVEKSIAVLPLDNLSPDPENGFFADGVHEDVLTHLSKIKELLVIGRTSTLQYRDTVKTLRQIGSELDVRYLVEGSVRRAANQVQVTVQLIDAQTGGHLWAENYNGSLDDIFSLQASIAEQIAGKLRAAISPEEIERIKRIPTKNQDAYDYFLKAGQQDRAFSKIELYEKAVELDPNFAEAWAYLAWYRSVDWRFEKNRNDPVLLAKIHDALDQAIRINPDLPEVLHAQANVISAEQIDEELAIEYLLKALEIDPNFWPSKQALGLRYHILGHLAKAQHYYQEAHRSEPITGPNAWLVDVYVSRKLWGKAADFVGKELSRGDSRNGIEGYWSRYLARIAYLENGDLDAYIKALYQSPGYQDNPSVIFKNLLCDRDLEAALQSIEVNESSSGWRISYAGINAAMPLAGSEVIQPALIWFDRGDQAKWMDEQKKALVYFKNIAENDALADPLFQSNLAICYALEGDREKTESTVVKVRQSTSLPRWKSYRQARCEIDIAICYLILDDNQKAIEILEAASKINSSFLLNRFVDCWFIFDRLRGNPRFDALLED